MLGAFDGLPRKARAKVITSGVGCGGAAPAAPLGSRGTTIELGPSTVLRESQDQGRLRAQRREV